MTFASASQIFCFESQTVRISETGSLRYDTSDDLSEKLAGIDPELHRESPAEMRYVPETGPVGSLCYGNLSPGQDTPCLVEP